MKINGAKVNNVVKHAVCKEEIRRIVIAYRVSYTEIFVKFVRGIGFGFVPTPHFRKKHRETVAFSANFQYTKKVCVSELQNSAKLGGHYGYSFGFKYQLWRPKPV